MRTNLKSVVGQLAVATVVLGGIATPTAAATTAVRNGRVASLTRTAASGNCPAASNAVGNPLRGTGDGETRNARC